MESRDALPTPCPRSGRSLGLSRSGEVAVDGSGAAVEAVETDELDGRVFMGLLHDRIAEAVAAEEEQSGVFRTRLAAGPDQAQGAEEVE